MSLANITQTPSLKFENANNEGHRCFQLLYALASITMLAVGILGLTGQVNGTTVGITCAASGGLIGLAAASRFSSERPEKFVCMGLPPVIDIGLGSAAATGVLPLRALSIYMVAAAAFGLITNFFSGDRM